MYLCDDCFDELRRLERTWLLGSPPSSELCTLCFREHVGFTGGSGVTDDRLDLPNEVILSDDEADELRRNGLMRCNV